MRAAAVPVVDRRDRCQAKIQSLTWIADTDITLLTRLRARPSTLVVIDWARWSSSAGTTGRHRRNAQRNLAAGRGKSKGARPQGSRIRPGKPPSLCTTDTASVDPGRAKTSWRLSAGREGVPADADP